MASQSYLAHKNNEISSNAKDQRLDVKVLAEIELRDGSHIHGMTKNMSYSGAFVEFKDAVTIMTGESCVLSITLHDKPDPDVLKMRCKVKHIRQNGVGLEIEAIDDNEINDFVFLLASKSDDPNAMLAALTSNRSVELRCDELI